MSVSVSWTDFARASPDLAATGRAMLYAFDVGLGFLATVRLDGGPRVHPVCPIFVDDHLYTMIIPGPKLNDLRRDGRYALHSETFPPPLEDDGFYVSGTVVEVRQRDLIEAIAAQFFAERPGMAKWPGFDDQVLYELLLERALLTLTQARDGFARGSTVWKAP